MPVPEAAIYQDDLTIPGKHDVRPAWEALDVEAETEPHPVQQTPDKQFWLCVRSMNAGHQPAAALWREPVHGYFLEASKA